ncbi:MAG TPA: HAMP domain-containing sensor histidine kinase, partial [Vicinamibacterales bacterium]|nr:HAMP domain-containing sensor histidine kinase [Vicinamibacterales bacterium]
AFGALAGVLRRWYRHTTHAMRLVLLFGALAGPPLINYPLTAAAADGAARQLIETEFAPAMLRQPEAVQEALRVARQEIDAIPQLALLVAGSPPGDSGSAYAVWSRTSLATARLTSEIELFGRDRRLLSRFALNVPEYPYGENAPVWSGTGCAWDVFGEVARNGAVERVLLHAERGICADDGTLLGAIVVHVLPDFASLPFVASGSPYAQALRDESADELASQRLGGLEVAAYGWNHDPQFTSGRVAWPISPAIAERLYASRDPFWATLAAAGTIYTVHFVNDRRGVYALGYPHPTFIEHATRVAEITAIAAVLLVVLLAGATAYAPVVRAHATPLPGLLHEIRTSFYRKLFLFFVLSAVGPVILLALAFGAYTAARIRADVEAEAASAVMTTRRLFEEFTAVEARPATAQAASHDALLVLIRQMTQQDVNLYLGPRLVATSQRDLFDSGLLPTRTPARVYREIAFNRVPTFVGEDRIGQFGYLLAASPVPSEGRDAVISVPLGNRQREIEHELDELNRRVLVGALVVVLFAAGLGASVAGRVSDPVARLSRAARQIAAGRLDVRIVADTADELRRLVDDFNVMAGTLARQRAELGRTHQLKAWAQMARQVAHEIKNPLTPIQLATEHLQRVHEDQARPLGPVFDQCTAAILGQVKLLRQIASDFSNFAAEPTPRLERVSVERLVDDVVGPYALGIGAGTRIATEVAVGLPDIRVDRTLVARALTNLIENAIQAMPEGGDIEIRATHAAPHVTIAVADTGVGMDAEAASRAFEPYFSTKTGGSGLGLPNARRYVELCGGRMDLESEPSRGTTITMWVPVVPDAPAAGPVPTR